MGVHVDPVVNGESVMSGIQTQKEGKDMSGVGGLGQLLPNGLTVPSGKGLAGSGGQMKNGSGGMNGTQTGAALANGHRNGSVGPLNSSLDTSKDDSFTDIDVESVDKETGGSSTSSGATPSLDRPPLNNVTTNVNNGGSASASQNGSLTAGSNGTAAPGQSAVPPTTAAAALINSEKEEVDAKDWTPYFLGEMPLAQWLLAVKKYVVTPLLRHPRSMAFRKPVDAKALGIFPIYNQVITRPMDLGTVKEKVDKKLYNAKAVVLQDIDLVWNNALKFNPSGHEVHEAAAFLQKHTLGHCLKAMVVNQGSLTTVGSVPTTPLSRQTSVREARKKVPGLPGEYDDLKPQHLEQKYVSNLSAPLKACDGILRSLMLQAQHWDFVEPFMKATRPGAMSFGVIQERMRSCHYTTSREFANDVRRIITETYRYAENPEEDFKSQKASKLQREFERQFAVSVSSFSDEEEAQAARAWAVQADPFIQKLVSAQQLVASMNGSVDRLVSDYEVIKVAFKARKAAERLQSTSRKPRASPVKKQRPSTASKDSTAPPGARKRPPTDSPAKKPAAKRQKQNPSSASKVPKQQPPYQHPVQQPQHQSALNKVSNKPSAEQIGAWIGMLEDSKQENLLEILRSNGEKIEVDDDGSVELSLETWSQKTLDEVELFLRREIPSENSSSHNQQQHQQQQHNTSKGDSSSSDSSSSDSSSSSESSDDDE